MVKVRDDLTDLVFGNWKVLKQAEDYISPGGFHMAQWECENLEDGRIDIFLGQELKKGGISKTLGKNKNIFELMGDYGIGYTSNTHKQFYFDIEDFEKIRKYTWSEGTSGHVISGCNGDFGNKIIQLSHLVTDFKYDYLDHNDRNGLNNRKSNLRPSTHEENMKNKTVRITNELGMAGVSKTSNNKWKSSIGLNNKSIYIGTYDNIIDAIMIRLYCELYFYGDFAPQRDKIKKYGLNLNNVNSEVIDVIKQIEEKKNRQK